MSKLKERSMGIWKLPNLKNKEKKTEEKWTELYILFRVNLKLKQIKNQNLWVNIKCPNIHVVKVLGGEDKRKERIFEEIMFKNFPNLMKSINLQIQKSQQTPSTTEPRRSILDISEPNCQSQR